MKESQNICERLSAPSPKKTYNVNNIMSLIITALSILFFFYNNGFDVFKGLGFTLINSKLMLFYPNHQFTLGDAIFEIITVFGLAFIATLSGGIVAFFFSLIALNKLVSKRTAYMAKGLMALIQAVPSIVWVLIFASVIQLGSYAAVVGLTLHSIGYLTVAYTELLGNLDINKDLLSRTFFRLIINFANALAIGALAGNSGVGFDSFMTGGYWFYQSGDVVIAYFLLVFAIVLEMNSNKKYYFTG